MTTFWKESGCPAIDSVIDAYAMRILRLRSPEEACIDDSLGPYVTSLLRCSLLSSSDNVTEMPEYESLIELLIEHCNLDDESASGALKDIAKAIKTGEVDVRVENDIDCNKLKSTGSTLTPVEKSRESSTVRKEDTTKIIERSSISQSGMATSSLAANVSISVRDSQSVPTTAVSNREKCNTETEQKLVSESFPPLTVSSNKTAKSKLPPVFGNNEGREKSKISTNGERYNSENFDIHGYPCSSPQVPTLQEEHMLLSMNPEISEAAASAAYALARNDINIAQYIIDQAMAAPPVCRHMLTNGCYRSDCTFSHDVENHSCLFWIRGRCGKGKESCRFLHGFSEKLLDGIDQNFLYEKKGGLGGFPTYHENNSNYSVVYTKNLLNHNMGRCAPSRMPCPIASSNFPPSYQNQNGGYNWVENLNVQPKLEKRAEQSSKFSFASVAMKGSDNTKHWPTKRTEKSNFFSVSQKKEKFVRIPQNLWNYHINRDAGAFHIIDPIARYIEVSKTCTSDNVIDLHFQSTKTFSTVLSAIIPQKFQKHEEVWIITGSGHHVDRRSHQKGGGALESVVLSWLENEGYNFVRGRDSNGHSGAVLVKNY